VGGQFPDRSPVTGGGEVGFQPGAYPSPTPDCGKCALTFHSINHNDHFDFAANDCRSVQQVPESSHKHEVVRTLICSLIFLCPRGRLTHHVSKQTTSAAYSGGCE
jgi:hypothetical protein